MARVRLELASGYTILASDMLRVSLLVLVLPFTLSKYHTEKRRRINTTKITKQADTSMHQLLWINGGKDSPVSIETRSL